jgi:hypothetical protein
LFDDIEYEMPDISDEEYLKLFKEQFKCRRCGYNEFACSIDFHHIDKNKHNNSAENFILLCSNCHKSLHLNKWDLLKSEILPLDLNFNIIFNPNLKIKKELSIRQMRKIKCFWNGGNRLKCCNHEDMFERCKYDNVTLCKYYIKYTDTK